MMNPPMQMCSEWLAKRPERRVVLTDESVILEAENYTVVAHGGSTLEERLVSAFTEAAKRDGVVRPVTTVRVESHGVE